MLRCTTWSPIANISGGTVAVPVLDGFVVVDERSGIADVDRVLPVMGRGCRPRCLRARRRSGGCRRHRGRTSGSARSGCSTRCGLVSVPVPATHCQLSWLLRDVAVDEVRHEVRRADPPVDHQVLGEERRDHHAGAVVHPPFSARAGASRRRRPGNPVRPVLPRVQHLSSSFDHFGSRGAARRACAASGRAARSCAIEVAPAQLPHERFTHPGGRAAGWRPPVPTGNRSAGTARCATCASPGRSSWPSSYVSRPALVHARSRVDASDSPPCTTSGARGRVVSASSSGSPRGDAPGNRQRRGIACIERHGCASQRL